MYVMRHRLRWASSAVEPGALRVLGSVLLLAILLVRPVDAASSADAARERDRAALVEQIQQWVAASGLEDARLGVHVMSLTDGEEVFAKRSNVLLNPASNIKLITVVSGG